MDKATAMEELKTPPVQSSEFRKLLSSMTNAEKSAAARFNETTEDGEGYDVSKPMMRRLRELGLVRHCGGGYYEQTDFIIELEEELKQYSRY